MNRVIYRFCEFADSSMITEPVKPTNSDVYLRGNVRHRSAETWQFKIFLEDEHLVDKIRLRAPVPALRNFTKRRFGPHPRSLPKVAVNSFVHKSVIFS